jgi:hypothetical protein
MVMGCDFFWGGSVPQPDVQERLVRFLRGCYRSPAVVRPEPARRVRALVERKHLSQPHFEPCYPFDFFGIIPYEALPGFRDRSHFVFDRSNGGRMVTLVPAERLAVDDWGAEFEVRYGGYVRHMEESRAFALLLNILRLRYCDDLSAADDYLNVRDVARDISSWGLAPWLCSDSNDWSACQARYFDLLGRHRPPPPPPPPEPPLHLPRAPQEVTPEVAGIRVESLDLSIRTLGGLENAGIETVGALLQWSPRDLLRTKHFGRKSLKEVRTVLAALGLRLREED